MSVINLEELSQVDIRTVNPKSLANIRDIEINSDKSTAQKFTDFVSQIHNPYCFKCGNIAVKIGFSDTDVTLENCLEGYFKTL